LAFRSKVYVIFKIKKLVLEDIYFVITGIFAKEISKCYDNNSFFNNSFIELWVGVSF